MQRQKIGRKRKKKLYLIFLASFYFVFFLASIISLKLAIARYQFPQPEAILTLGGGQDREEFTSKFAQTHPSLEIWVSSGSPTEQAIAIFRQAGISNNRVNIDRRATDTVTNFTSLVKDFQKQNIHHVYVYLITSDFHMNRAKAIAFFVLGSHDITFEFLGAIGRLHGSEIVNTHFNDTTSNAIVVSCLLNLYFVL